MSDSTIAPILGRLPSGIFVLTAQYNGQETGMLASWVQQAGFEPPMITAAVQRQRYVADWLSAGEPFVLNVLREKQKHHLRHFVAGFEPDDKPFEGLEVTRSSRGLAILPDALGYLECEPVGNVDSGDHRVFLARVISGQLLDNAEPMVHVRKNGLRY